MADIVTNDQKGALFQLIADGEDLIVIPLSAVDTDANMIDGYAVPSFLDDVLGDAANTEAIAGGWGRRVHLNAVVTPTIDDAANDVTISLVDSLWTAVAGGNDVVALLIAIDGASDAVRRVVTKHDFAVTTDGNDVTADFDDADGIWQAA
jgi:hypothetical protein